MKYAPRTLVRVPPVVWWVAQQGRGTVLFFGQENESGVKAEEQAAGIARHGDEGSAYGAYVLHGSRAWCPRQIGALADQVCLRALARGSP